MCSWVHTGKRGCVHATWQMRMEHASIHQTSMSQGKQIVNNEEIQDHELDTSQQDSYHSFSGLMLH